MQLVVPYQIFIDYLSPNNVYSWYTIHYIALRYDTLHFITLHYSFRFALVNHYIWYILKTTLR